MTARIKTATNAMGIGSLLFGAMCVEASGQERLWHWFGETGLKGNGNQFGISVSRIGDVDGDGWEDAIVGAPLANPVTSFPNGAVYVFSGRTGVLIRRHDGPGKYSYFGQTISSLADFDGDSVLDYVVGAPLYSKSTLLNAGRIDVFSGVSGVAIHSVIGSNTSDQLGSEVSALDDLTRDGLAEFAAVASLLSAGGGLGEAYVYSGADASVVGVFSAQPNEILTFVGRLPDLNADSIDEIGIGVEGYATLHQGRFDVYDGASFALLYSIDGESSGERFGGSAATLDDVDGDGIDDFSVADRDYGTFLSPEGRAYVFSGATGSLLYSIDGRQKDERFGVQPRSGRLDFNDDGFGDILIGSPHFDDGGPGLPDGIAQVYSGRSGTLLYEFRGELSESLGAAVSSAGDMNGDGISDVIVGAPDGYDASGYSTGCAYVFGGNDLFLQADKDGKYGSGSPITLDTRGGEPGATTLLAVTKLNGSPTFITVAVSMLDSNGNSSLTDTVPPGLSGLTIELVAYATRGSKKGLAVSGVEEIEFR